MIGKPSHSKRLGFIGASLTNARPAQLPRHETVAAAREPLREELERMLLESGYLEDAPFWWVTLCFQYGLKDNNIPSYERINKKYGDLPLSIEIDTDRIFDAAERTGSKPIYDVEKLKHIFKVAALKALIHAGKKYKRPVEALERELARIAAESGE